MGRVGITDTTMKSCCVRTPSAPFCVFEVQLDRRCHHHHMSAESPGQHTTQAVERIHDMSSYWVQHIITRAASRTW